MVKRSKNPKVISIILMVAGSIFFVGGGILTFFSYDFMENSASVKGTVVSVEVSHGDNSTTYKPTIRYLGLDGQKHVGRTFMSSSSYNFDVNARVDIRYDIRTPSSIRMDTWFATWGFGIVFLAASVIPFVIAGVVAARTGRRKPTVTSSPMRVNPARDTDDGYMNMKTRESAAEHAREDNYKPTVRRS